MVRDFLSTFTIILSELIQTNLRNGKAWKRHKALKFPHISIDGPTLPITQEFTYEQICYQWRNGSRIRKHPGWISTSGSGCPEILIYLFLRGLSRVFDFTQVPRVFNVKLLQNRSQLILKCSWSWIMLCFSTVKDENGEFNKCINEKVTDRTVERSHHKSWVWVQP